MKKSIVELMRPNVEKMKGYKSARHDYQGSAHIFLDANENPFDWEFNRYPDPHHFRLKRDLWKTLGWDMSKITLGNGSDELIDLLLRAFCIPGKDAIRVLNPSYGMYDVSAELNNIKVIKTDLDENFQLDSDLRFLDNMMENEKIFFITSPNNPSGNVFHPSILKDIISRYDGLVVIDEAYIDFASRDSLYHMIDENENLVVLRTFSKAFASAGLRVGIALAGSLITNVLHKIKPPYNLSSIVMDEAIKMFKNYEKIKIQTHLLRADRDNLISQLKALNFVKKVFPSEANFILVRVDNANELYNYLRKKGIIVRNRHGQYRCDNCLRFTVGTPIENKSLMDFLLTYNSGDGSVI
jgi:histidinol-phosphate aminotransferase